MTEPAVSAMRFGIGLLLGCGLGLGFDFLRPVRPRFFGDLIFCGLMGLVWLYFSFGVCQCDLRLGYAAALILGAIFWCATAGRLLRPVFRGFWKGFYGFFSLIFLPFRKIFQKSGLFLKKVFAYVKKWVTIEWNRRWHRQRMSGGNDNEETGEPAVQLQIGISSRQARTEDYAVSYVGGLHDCAGDYRCFHQQKQGKSRRQRRSAAGFDRRTAGSAGQD
jgi:hypothetical protein